MYSENESWLERGCERKQESKEEKEGENNKGVKR